MTAPVTKLALAPEGKLIVGMKTGKCEVWSITSQGNKKLYEATAGRGNPILDVDWVYYTPVYWKCMLILDFPGSKYQTRKETCRGCTKDGVEGFRPRRRRCP